MMYNLENSALKPVIPVYAAFVDGSPQRTLEYTHVAALGS